MVLNHGLINQYIDIITPARDKSPMNMSLLCSSFNIHEGIIQEATSMWYSWGRPEGDAACRRCVCVFIYTSHQKHAHTHMHAHMQHLRQRACGSACFTLMTSPSWLGSRSIFHRLSSVAVERPPPIPAPSSLNVYNTGSLNDRWHRFLGLIQRQHHVTVQNPATLLLPPPTLNPPSSKKKKPFQLSDCLMRGVQGYLSPTVWAEYWAGLLRGWYDMWQPIIWGYLC